MKSVEQAVVALTIALVAVWSVSSVALAQATDDDRARMHFQAGQSYFDQGQYAQSAQQFDDAYRLSQRPRLLVNASLAYERAGNLTVAIERIEAFLASDSEEAQVTRATQTSRLESLRARLSAEQALAARVEAEAATQPAAAEAEQEAPPSRSGLRVAGIAIGGVGIALGATALALTLKSRSIHGELEDVCGPSGDACPPDRADDIDRGRTFGTVSTITMVGSIASLAAGSTLFILGSRHRQDAPATSAFLDVAPGRVGITAFGRF